MPTDSRSKVLETSSDSPVPNPREYRRALGRFATGVTVVTAHHDNLTHGMTANSFVSVSLDPPLILISVDNRSHLNQILPLSGRYAVSVLAENQEALSNHFAGRKADGLEVTFATCRDFPVIEGALAYFIARIVDVHPAGDHTLYIGHVEHFESADAKPLLFFLGCYGRVRPMDSL